MLLQNFICMFYFFFGLCSGLVTDGSSDYIGAFVVFNYTKDNNGSMIILGSSTVEAGSYGSHSPKVNVSGVIRLPFSDLHDDGDKFGCKSTYPHVVAGEKWIALIARGHCMFSDKILNAQQRNASAVLIYDYEGESTVTIMSHPDAEDIVAVSIQNQLGRSVTSLAQEGRTLYATITTGCSHTYMGSFRFSNTSFVFVSASFIVLMIVSFSWLVFYYIERFRHQQARVHGKKCRMEAAKKVLSSLTSRSLKQSDGSIEDGVCAICLSSYKEGDRVRDLPCRHIFHKKCIDPWIQDKHTCPMCKLDVIKAIDADKERNRSSPSANNVESQRSNSLPEAPAQVGNPRVDVITVSEEVCVSGGTERSTIV